MNITSLKLLKGIAAMLCTVKEFGSIPSGVAYSVMATAYSLDEYTGIVNTMLRAGWITQSGHVLAITDLGKRRGDEFEAAISEGERRRAEKN